jgi:hypothetical protein
MQGYTSITDGGETFSGNDTPKFVPVRMTLETEGLVRIDGDDFDR